MDAMGMSNLFDDEVLIQTRVVRRGRGQGVASHESSIQLEPEIFWNYKII